MTMVNPTGKNEIDHTPKDELIRILIATRSFRQTLLVVVLVSIPVGTSFKLQRLHAARKFIRHEFAQIFRIHARIM